MASTSREPKKKVASNYDGKALVGSRPATITELLKSRSSTLAKIMLALDIIHQYCPNSLCQHLQSYLNQFIDYIYPSPYVRIAIYEFVGINRSRAFEAVESYLSTKISDGVNRLKAEIGNKNNFSLSLDDYETVTDKYENAKFWWTLGKTTGSMKRKSTDPIRRCYQLEFHKKHRNLVMKSYLKHVLKKGREMRVNRRQRKLYTNGDRYLSYGNWSGVNFEHPANFDTIGMDPVKKQEIIEDLITFSQSKSYYTRIGKMWKRGYLLYGPPGTGKSTMIAAMANLLKYDVYDLELTAVKDNIELRNLLIQTTSKSIIVIEDIDCSLELTRKRLMKKKNEDGKSNVTLSGLLNFLDGIWSACDGERLIVFTTNHMEKLDPALIRSGRMDKHIELSYCSFEAFKLLAKNYLNVETHELFEKIEELIKEVKITPADVAENLVPKSRQEVAEDSLRRLIQTLEEMKKAAEMAKTKIDKKTKKSEELPEIVNGDGYGDSSN